MEAHDWIQLGVLLATLAGSLIAMVRYQDRQKEELKDQLSDKLSIGEYNRRHDDLEKRLRNVERWQDHANGRYGSTPLGPPEP